MLWLGVSLWPSHPSSYNTSMPWIILSLGSFLHTWLGLNPWTQPWGKRVTELYGFVCKNKAMGYISVYYNIASQDKANYLSPTTTERFTVLIILHCGEKKTCLMLIPWGSADGDSFALYLEVLTLFHIYLAFSNICLWLIRSAKLYFLDSNGANELSSNFTFLVQVQALRDGSNWSFLLIIPTVHVSQGSNR